MSTKFIFPGFLLLNMLMTALAGEPETDRRDRYGVTASGHEIKIDGQLDEPAWASAARIIMDNEYSPGDNVTPPVNSECLVTYDDQHFYVAFRCDDPEPARIRAHLMDRDDIFTFVQDDHVGFFIDTFNDERRGFQFRINPLGVQVDAVFSELEGVEDFSWDAIWRSAGKITGEGYVVEVAIPLRQLRFPGGGQPQTWSMEAFRSYPRQFRHRISNSIRDRDVNCIICQMDKLEGLEGLSPGRNLQITPTVTSSRNDNRPRDGQWQNGDEDNELGLTLRWGITPDTTLTGALNPDFSHVEADVAQLQVNTRFALFFPEKRPFFLESIDTFTTPINAVFTRTVVNPEAAAKFNGKTGVHTYGLFLAEDEINNVLIPANQGSAFATLPGQTTSGVFRYRRDVGRNSTVGALYTGRQGDGYHNNVLGIDGFFRLNTKDTLQFQYLYSDTDYGAANATAVGGETSPQGDGLHVQYKHQVRKWNGTVAYEDLDRGLRLDNGFIPRVDLRQLSTKLERSWWGNDKTFFSLLNLGIQAGRVEDQSGTLSDENLQLYFNTDGGRQAYFEAKLGSFKERYLTTTYDMTRGELFYQLQPSGKWKFGLWARFGDAIDYAGARPADLLETDVSVELKLGRRVNLQASNTGRRLDVAGGRLLEENLTQLRAVYHFNLRTFLRLITQYRDTSQNELLYTGPVAPESENLFNQLLFSYKVNPQTAFLLGYADNQIGEREFGLTRNNRTFFLKLGYAWLR